MATLAPQSDSGNTRYDFIINTLLDERLGMFRQITVYDEIALATSPSGTANTATLTFGGWNTSGFDPIVERNGTLLTETTQYAVDGTNGKITLVTNWRDGEEILVTYNFCYITNDALLAFLKHALQMLNSSYEPLTAYKINDCPTSWDGPLAETAYQMALRKIRMEAILWKTRLLLSVPDEVMGNLDVEIAASEDRLNIMSEGIKTFKYASKPTAHYYQAISGFGARGGIDPYGVGYGRMRGYKANKTWASY